MPKEKKKRKKTSTKDDMDRDNIKRKISREMGRNDKWQPHHKKINCASRHGATTKYREGAINRILRRSDKMRLAAHNTRPRKIAPCGAFQEGQTNQEK
jgi:hypothetical protein